MSDPRRRRNQRGFSLIVVFLLILVMVGVSSTVMLSTQGDLQVSGHDRESASALYAAEAGVAWAQWWLSRYPVPSQAGSWTGLLTSATPSVQAAFCAAPGGNPAAPHPWTAVPPAAPVVATPGQFAAPNPGTPVIYDSVRGISYQWCIHNNALDPNYLSTGVAAGDLADGDNLITIESYGWYGTGPMATALASAHLTVDVSYFNANVNLANDYQQAGSGPTKQGRGEASPNLAGSVSRSL